MKTPSSPMSGHCPFASDSTILSEVAVRHYAFQRSPSSYAVMLPWNASHSRRLPKSWCVAHLGCVAYLECAHLKLCLQIFNGAYIPNGPAHPPRTLLPTFPSMSEPELIIYGEAGWQTPSRCCAVLHRHEFGTAQTLVPVPQERMRTTNAIITSS